MTRADSLARAENGAIVAGNAADVEALQVGKAADMSVAETMQLLERRLSFTFLMNESVQRDAERVIATDQTMEQLNQGWQGLFHAEPRVAAAVDQACVVPDGAGRRSHRFLLTWYPQITTGLEAIGRGNDNNVWSTSLATMLVLGPEDRATDQSIRTGTSLAASDGIDGLVKTEQDTAQQFNALALSSNLPAMQYQQEPPARCRRSKQSDDNNKVENTELPKGSRKKPPPDGGFMIIKDNFIN